MKQWRYRGPDKAELKEVYSVGEEAPATETEPEKKPRLFAIHVELVPGEIFEAPDDWNPYPDPHPLFEPVGDEPPKKTNKSSADTPQE